MSAASKTLLQQRYRDQIIRELEVVRSRTAHQFSNEVVNLMTAVDRDKARILATKHYWWRRFIPNVYVRRDDLLPSSDLYLLEATLIEHLDEDELKIRVAGYRDLLSHLLTDESFGKLVNVLDSVTTKSSNSTLSEARALISRLYRRYEGVPAVERIRSTTAIRIGGVAILIVIIVFSLIYSHIAPDMLAAGAFGAVGAAVSAVGRLYNLDSRQEPFGMWLTLESGRLTLIWSPLFGLIFALVLAVLIGSGLLGGTLFPDARCWSLFSNVTNGCKSPQLELAKFFGWSFLAGWAERMVPDVLERLVPQAASSLKVK